MQIGREDVKRWLIEERRGVEDTAEAAFEHMFAALPMITPRADFVDRAVDAAWRTRLRRRRMLVLTRAAALLLFAVGGAVLAYVVASSGGAWVLRTGAVLVSRSFVWLVVSIAGGMEWWSSLAQIGNSVAETVAMPRGTAALVVIELVGALSLYALQRLLRGDGRFRSPGAFCI
jgi:hypothetical protein